MNDFRVSTQVLTAFLRVRGLLMQRSSLSEQCASKLLAMMKVIYSDSNDDQRATLKAYITALSQPHADQRTPLFILEQVCNIIAPS